MAAARTGKADIVKTLAAHGANVNAKESWRGQTALMWAGSRRKFRGDSSPRRRRRRYAGSFERRIHRPSCSPFAKEGAAQFKTFSKWARV